MREILFRGKDAESGEWVYGYYVHFETMHKVIYAIYTDCSDDYSGGLVAHCYDVNPETVGQYTGMTDKNGKKIFEGDIIRTDDNLIGAVEWNNTFAKYIVCYNQISGNWFDFEGEDCFSVALDCVIIGNVHDNPELLNK